MKRFALSVFYWSISLLLFAQPVREHILFDEDWRFAFGNASDPVKDFGCGTEYFNYLTKAASIHNEGPYSSKFDASNWKQINLPHDWVVDLPFDSLASHSHGYKKVGYQYPETSVGWYRKEFTLDNNDLGKHITLQFDGIFRDSRIWVNGFYIGHEESGYATQLYDITDYLNYGGKNLVTVRVDATLAEGWFYEGAGIYRHVWLNKTAPLHIAPFGTFVHSTLDASFQKATLTVEATVENASLQAVSYHLRHSLRDAGGMEVARSEEPVKVLSPKTSVSVSSQMAVEKPRLWSTVHPYLYTLLTEVYNGEKLVDTYTTTLGIRQIAFDKDKGFLLNGKVLKLKGVNMHQDHPGVGIGLPDALQTYRLKQLKSIGCNAYRSSHNPMTPEMLDACDREGILVIEENRLMGINQEYIDLLKRMIVRDRNHPCIILWSIGNEEWGIESKDTGLRIAATMREYCHQFDSTRPVTAALSGGNQLLKSLDVVGYNYIVQNPVEEYHKVHPDWIALGSEETSGAGTRGIYFDDPAAGHMVAYNRKPYGPDSTMNVIARGWKFYSERPYLGGLFYWTGFDYRGEPNPLKYPATGSQYGIFDYCGFPKDEAFYLKAWWTKEPVLHILPHWNLSGHEGENVDVWVYSNCDEVELIVNGKKLGKKSMMGNGYLSWRTVYSPGSIKAIGYKSGKRVMIQNVETAGKPSRIVAVPDHAVIKADNRDVAVFNVELRDEKGRFVPTACTDLVLTIEGPVRILGVGNGDPAYRDKERPENPSARTFHIKTFNGLAQVLLQSTHLKGKAMLTLQSKGLPTCSCILETH